MSSSLQNQSVVGLRVEECTITSSTGEKLDFKNAVVEYSYFEDIFSNFVSGSLMISDSSAFQNKLKWTGNEILELVIDKPNSEDSKASGRGIPLGKHEVGGANGSKKLETIKYRIFNIKSRKLGNDTNENFTIQFCSDALMLSEQTKISKSYKQMKISDIIKDICKTYLNLRVEDVKDKNGNVILPSQVGIEETFGTRDIVIPKLRPFEAINWLCTQAISNVLPGNLKNGAQYLFWQNRDAYFFNTILFRLYNKEKYVYQNPLIDSNSNRLDSGGYWYGTKNIEYSSPQYSQYEQIISFEVMNSYDTMESSQRGMYANRMIALDHVRRMHENADFNYNDYWKHLNGQYDFYKNKKFNAVPAFEPTNKEVAGSLESTIKIYPSTTNQKDSKYIKSKVPNISANYVENTVPYRYAQMALLGHNRLKLMIPGDPYISAGLIIKVTLTKTSKGLDPTAGNLEDQYLSGYYVISALRHILNQENEFNTVLELVKDSYHPPSL